MKPTYPSKRLSSTENWHERSSCNPWCGDPKCLHIDSAGGYPDLRNRTRAMIMEGADSPASQAITYAIVAGFFLIALFGLFS